MSFVSKEIQKKTEKLSVAAFSSSQARNVLHRSFVDLQCCYDNHVTFQFCSFYDLVLDLTDLRRVTMILDAYILQMLVWTVIVLGVYIVLSVLMSIFFTHGLLVQHTLSDAIFKN